MGPNELDLLSQNRIYGTQDIQNLLLNKNIEEEII